MMGEVLAHKATTRGRIPTTGEPVSVQPRLEAVDLVRGVVMVLMALDHVRDFFSSARFDPLDLTQTNPALFVTRWVTHFCAPVFVFLAGTSAFLYGTRGKTRRELAWFLYTRGLWLVLLEFTLVHFGWFFRFDYNILIGQVIWAIGWSMVALAGVVVLPTWVITALGIILIAGHNLLDRVSPDKLGMFSGLWKMLCSGGALQPREGFVFFVLYPILPWLGVMLAGYGFGALWLLEPHRRRRLLTALGLGATMLFVVLRGLNFCGDPQPWTEEKSGLFTFLSFLNCQKYPPSLLFVLMTLGPAILLLAWVDRKTGPLGEVFVTFGRVPLFYYLLHVPLIHLLAMAFAYFRYGRVDFLLQHIMVVRPGQLPEGYGYGLGVVYLIWLLVVLLLYPACRWFAELKRGKRASWLSYL
jgi:uncharacterized membrane protein